MSQCTDHRRATTDAVDPWALAQAAPSGGADPFNIFVVGALASLAGFTAKLVLDVINDLRKRLDGSMARTDAAIQAGHEVTTSLQQLTAVVQSLVDTVGREHHPPEDPKP